MQKQALRNRRMYPARRGPSSLRVSMRGTFYFLTALVTAFVPLDDWRRTYTPDPETHFSMPEYSSPAQWEARREDLRRQILSAAGLLPMPPKTPLEPRLAGRTVVDGIVIDTVLLETLPGYYVGGNLYRPAVVRGKAPAVLSPHGHWKRGRVEHRESYSVPALGVNLARQGYFVFTWDMVGYNDTRQTSHSFDGWRERLWSFTPLGLQLWNSIRAVDYLQSLELVDNARIAVTGASGGATQAFLLAAVDERIRASAPVNMISAYAQGADPCEEAPGLRVGSFNVEFAAMMAPRPMLVVSATGDWTRHTPREEFPAIRRIYDLYGAGDQVSNAHFDAGHNYNRASREAVYRFLAAHLRPPAPSFADRDIDLPDPGQLLASRHAATPPGALDYEGVFARWREMAHARAAAAGDDELREALRAALGAEWPSQVASAVERDRLVLSRPGRHDRLPGIWLPGAGPPVVIVHPEGAEAARKSDEARRLEAQGRFLFLPDVFQTGSAKAGRDHSGRWFLSYNRTDDAHRVQDILTALAYVAAQGRGGPHLIGLDRAAVWCLFASATAPLPVSVHAPLGDFEGADREFRETFFVPGVLQAGGPEAALRLTRDVRTSASAGLRRAPVSPSPDARPEALPE